MTGAITKVELNLAQLIKYCEWQINEAECHHPTLPSAVLEAKASLKELKAFKAGVQDSKELNEHIAYCYENNPQLGVGDRQFDSLLQDIYKDVIDAAKHLLEGIAE